MALNKAFDNVLRGVNAAATGALEARVPGLAAANQSNRALIQKTQQEAQNRKDKGEEQQQDIERSNLKIIATLQQSRLEGMPADDPLRADAEADLSKTIESLGVSDVSVEGLGVPEGKEQTFTDVGIFRTKAGDEFRAVKDSSGITKIQKDGQLILPSRVGEGQFFKLPQVTGSQEDVGISGTRKEKVIKEVAQKRIDTNNLDQGLEQVQNFVRSENFVGGLTGKTLSIINSASQQFAQTFGKETIFTNEGAILNELDERLSQENISFMRRAAISGDVREAAVARLAFIVAKQLNPDGKISDADVENAKNMISGTADRQSTLLMLQNLRDINIREADTFFRIMGETVKGEKDPFRPFSRFNRSGGDKPLSELTDKEALGRL